MNQRNIHLIFLALLLLGLTSCTKDEKAAQVVAEEVDRGAFLRTLDRVNSEFDIQNLDAEFEMVIQEQDLEDGALLENVEVRVSFIDNTIGASNFSTSEVLIETLNRDRFSDGSFMLPVTTLRYSFSELLSFVGVSWDNVEVKDQFVIRLKLNLNDGRSFSYENSSGCILLIESYYDSPFTYTINIVEPIAADLFTGSYVYESIVDGPFGPTWGPPILVEILKGNTDNLRSVSFDIVPDKIPRDYFFSIVGDESVFEKFQARFSANNLDCGPSGTPIVLGPDTENAIINPIDDSVFELWLVEGYEGFDGGRGFGTVPSRIRFTKQ